MLMNKLTLTILLGAFSLPNLMGCGSASDPLLSLGDDTKNVAFALPSSSGGSVTGFFSTNLPAFTVTTGSGVVAAPAAGLVIETSSTSVTIRHNNQIASTLSSITSVSARPGDFVAAGANLGTSFSVVWTVSENGTAVCPYTFLSSTVRAALGAAQYCL